MPASAALTVRSPLDAPADEVWDAVTSLRGVNEELGPWVHMAVPFGYDRLEDSMSGWSEPLFHATLWGLGAVPVDRWRLHLDALEPERRLAERSDSLWFRHWRHERTLEPTGRGVTVIDRVVFEPRLPGVAPLLLGLVAWLFEARHAVLRARHGTSASGRARAERTLGAGAEQETALVVGGILGVLLTAAAAAFVLGRRKD